MDNATPTSMNLTPRQRRALRAATAPTKSARYALTTAVCRKTTLRALASKGLIQLTGTPGAYELTDRGRQEA